MGELGFINENARQLHEASVSDQPQEIVPRNFNLRAVDTDVQFHPDEEFQIVNAAAHYELLMIADYKVHLGMTVLDLDPAVWELLECRNIDEVYEDFRTWFHIPPEKFDKVRDHYEKLATELGTDNPGAPPDRID